MITVDLIIKVKEKEKISRKLEKSIEIDRPKTFKEFDNEIRNKFNLIGKEIGIAAIDEDEEEVYINDEEEYSNNKTLKKYCIFPEEDFDKDSKETLDLDKLFDVSKELTIDENEFKSFLDKELDKEINEEFKIEEDEKNDEIKLETDLNNFISGLTEKIEVIKEDKKKTILEAIKKEYSSIHQLLDKTIKGINDNIKNHVDEVNDAKEKMSQIKIDMHQDDIPENDNPQEDIQEKPIIKPKPKMFSLSTINMEYNIDFDKAEEFVINDIKIKNILNEKIDFNHKYWIRHEDSDSDIFIPSGKNMVKVDDRYLEENEIKKGELILSIRNPKKGEKYMFKFYIGDNSQDNSKYENVTEEPLVIYIILKKEEEKIDMNNKIHIVEKPNDEIKEEEKKKIENDKKKDEDEDEKNKNKNDHGEKGEELTEEKIEEIYNELEEEFYVSGVVGEDVIKEKIRELNGNIEQLREFIKPFM